MITEAESFPPSHLTPFGKWLWLRIPRWHYTHPAWGEGRVSLRTPIGFAVYESGASMADAYWPHSGGVLYWKRYVVVMSRSVLSWKTTKGRAAWRWKKCRALNGE